MHVFTYVTYPIYSAFSHIHEKSQNVQFTTLHPEVVLIENIPPKLQFKVITDLLVQSDLIVDTGDTNPFVLCSVFLVLNNTVPSSYQTISKMQNITLRK